MDNTPKEIKNGENSGNYKLNIWPGLNGHYASERKPDGKKQHCPVKMNVGDSFFKHNYRIEPELIKRITIAKTLKTNTCATL